MPPSSETNQNYLILKVLALAKKPIQLHELTEGMKHLCRKNWGNEFYVFGPAPLSEVIKEMSRTNDITFSHGAMALTEKGHRELRNTTPLFPRLLSEEEADEVLRSLAPASSG